MHIYYFIFVQFMYFILGWPTLVLGPSFYLCTLEVLCTVLWNDLFFFVCFFAVEEIDFLPSSSTRVDITGFELAGLYYTILTFNKIFIFSIEVNIAITIPDKKRAARQASEETCAIVFTDQDSESIVLVSNPVR